MATRGIGRLQDPRTTGAIVGAVGGSAFVLVNRGSLPDVLPGFALAAWVVALAGWAWFVLARPRTFAPLPAPSPRAGAVYGGSVVAMLVLIFGSARLLTATDHPGLVPAAVAVAVGLHFVPFARAFGAPVFGVLGWTMAGIGGVGLVAGLVGVGAAGSASAVVAGLAMIVLVAADAAR